MAKPFIALLTDFGTSDPYVGVMKGVMASRCPDIQFIDITHAVTPQNVREAAYLLKTAYRYFPPHTIFLVVVDPGVGTARNPLAIKTDHGYYVGPDNGVFSAVLDEVDTWQAVVIWPPERLSATFHGRDVFAPAAAALACGSVLHQIGTPTTDIVYSAPLRGEQIAPDLLQGVVIHADHFGNLVTSLGPFEWKDETLTLQWTIELQIEPSSAEVMVGNRQVGGIHSTYSSSQPGELLALINSDNQLEIAVNQGSAANLTQAVPGDTVQVRFRSKP